MDVVSRLRAAGCVFAEDEAALLTSSASSVVELEELVSRRVSGVPLEHLLGWVEFCGLRVAVEPGVFVPRQRTEFLVRQAVPLVSAGSAVVDLCCGCGALGAALAAFVPGISLYAADVDPVAVRCASRNVSQVFAGDLFDALPARLRGAVDVVMVNAPYVPTSAIGMMPPEARLYEPRPALDGGADGLDVLRRVISAAPAWLSGGGSLLFESSEDQAASVASFVRDSGMTMRVEQSDDFGATVVICGV